jgi:hypothetical protein
VVLENTVRSGRVFVARLWRIAWLKRDPLTSAAARGKISAILKNIFHGAFERERAEDQLQTL